MQLNRWLTQFNLLAHFVLFAFETQATSVERSVRLFTL